MYINEILTVLIITLGLGESETITWTGESSNDWDDSEKYFFNLLTHPIFVRYAYLCVAYLL